MLYDTNCVKSKHKNSKIDTISKTRISRDVVLYNVPDNVLGSVLRIVSKRIEAKQIAAARGM